MSIDESMYCLMVITLILHLIVQTHSAAVQTGRLNTCRFRREFGPLAVSERRPVKRVQLQFSFSIFSLLQLTVEVQQDGHGVE